MLSVPPELWGGDGSEAHSLHIRSGAPPELRFGGEALESADVAWVRHLPPPFPAIDTRPELPPLDRRELFVELMNARERAATVLAALDGLTQAGRPVINPPARGLGIQNKPSQLISIVAAGGRVPDTLVTDDPVAARAFAEGRRVVFKPTTGGALAVELDEQAKASLDLIVRAPVIFQELVEGEDVRVTIAGGKIASAVAVLTPAGTLDYRSDPGYAQGRAGYREVELPAEIARAVIRSAEVLELAFTGIDVRVDPARPERWAILEANPSPTYLDIELKTGHPITELLIDLLETAGPQG